MALYRRGGGVWWYSFVFNGIRIQRSSRVRDKEYAAHIEKTHRTMLKCPNMPVPFDVFLRFTDSSCTDIVKERTYICGWDNLEAAQKKNLETMLACFTEIKKERKDKLEWIAGKKQLKRVQKYLKNNQNA